MTVNRSVLAAPLLGTLLAACGGSPPEPAADAPPADPSARAERLAQESILVDTHVDVPYRLHAGGAEDLSRRTEGGDFDHPRARAGGLDAAFMSIYVPARLQETGGARELADQLIDMVEGFETSWPDHFAVVHSPAEVREVFGSGRVALPMGMENGAPIEGDLANLAHFHARGIRYVTLTHSEDNAICDSSYSDERTWGGLSPFGREVVAEMNRLGIMIDVSHISDDAFDQVMELTAAPVIASHSSCRHFTPGWERNMSDDMIRRLADNGGVLHINFGSAFLVDEARRQSEAAWSAYRENAAALGVSEDSEAARDFWQTYWAENPRVFADVSDVADHIDHVVELVGIDHVGLGSDFDGVGDSLPTGLKDASQYPNLLRELLERGYSEEDVRKICGENLLRVWERVEAVAAAG